MNAISIANNMIQLTANSKVALLAFGMFCVYKMLAGHDWFAKVLGVVLLVVAVVVLAGCVPADPMRSAQATERTNQSAISVNQSAAQIVAGQQSAEDARQAQERLEALQAQQAATQALQGIAEASARQGIAESNNAVLIKFADQIREASQPDNTVLIVVLVGAFSLAGLVIWKLFTVNAQLAQAIPAQPEPAQRTRREIQALAAPNYIQIPERVQAHAQRFGGIAEWDNDRWVIVDPNSGKLLATQRISSKLLKG